MSPDMKTRIESCESSDARADYLRSLRPAADLLVSTVVDSSELDTLRSLEAPVISDDLEVTARLPMLDIEALPVEVRANLGATAEDGTQAVA